jgi:hypothetical protein
MEPSRLSWSREGSQMEPQRVFRALFAGSRNFDEDPDPHRNTVRLLQIGTGTGFQSYAHRCKFEEAIKGIIVFG